MLVKVLGRQLKLMASFGRKLLTDLSSHDILSEKMHFFEKNVKFKVYKVYSKLPPPKELRLKRGLRSCARV